MRGDAHGRWAKPKAAVEIHKAAAKEPRALSDSHFSHILASQSAMEHGRGRGRGRGNGGYRGGSGDRRFDSRPPRNNYERRDGGGGGSGGYRGRDNGGGNRGGRGGNRGGGGIAKGRSLPQLPPLTQLAETYGLRDGRLVANYFSLAVPEGVVFYQHGVDFGVRPPRSSPLVVRVFNEFP